MSATLAVIGWVAGWLAAGRVHRLPPAAESAPPTSVVIPIRDEAARLPALLAALLRDPPGGRALEIVVVDDGSSDDGPALARASGATVLSAQPPPGWTGKAWACWQGALAARGEVVVFLDADTEPAPGFVARLAAHAGRTGGMVSVQPTHRVEAAYERASAVCNVVALMAGTGGTSGAAWWRRPAGFGPAVAVPRASYLAAGGHGLVRSDVADDVALAQALARGGVPVAAYADAGEGAIHYRMYPEGPAALARGWTKNLAAGARKVPPLRAALVAVWVTGAMQAAFTVPWMLAYVLYAAQAAVLFRRAGRFGLATAIAYPAPLLVFVVLFARSAAHRLTGRPVAWRGRLVAP